MKQLQTQTFAPNSIEMEYLTVHPNTKIVKFLKAKAKGGGAGLETTEKKK